MEDVDGDDEIAAAMGFSSFGHSKKRKFDQTNSPKAKIGASGANMTELGVRPKVVAGEDSLEPDAVEGIEATSFAATASQQNTNSNAKNKGKQKQKQPAATGLAAFLSRGQTLPEKPPTANTTYEAPSANQVAPVDPAASEMTSFGGPPVSRAELNALRSGVRVQNGDTAYFLPSFVEDPWGRVNSRA